MADIVCSYSFEIGIILGIGVVLGVPCLVAYCAACLLHNGKAEQLRNYKNEEAKQNAKD